MAVYRPPSGSSSGLQNLALGLQLIDRYFGHGKKQRKADLEGTRTRNERSAFELEQARRRAPISAQLDEAQLKANTLGNKKSEFDLANEREEKQISDTLTNFGRSLPDMQMAPAVSDPSQPWHVLSPEQRQTYLAQTPGVPIGDVARAVDQNVHLSTGLPVTPPGMEIANAYGQPGQVGFQFRPPLEEQVVNAPDGTPLGVRLNTGQFVSYPQERTGSQKLDASDKALLLNIPSLRSNLSLLRDTINTYGNYEKGPLSDPHAAALLAQLPYQIAVSYAKLVDPGSVAREGEVAAAQKYMIPMGMTTRNSVSIAAIDNMLKEVEARTANFQPMLPESHRPSLDTPDEIPQVQDPGASITPSGEAKFDSVAEAATSGLPVGTPVFVFDGGQYVRTTVPPVGQPLNVPPQVAQPSIPSIEVGPSGPAPLVRPSGSGTVVPRVLQIQPPPAQLITPIFQ